MSVIYVLIPIAILLTALGIYIFFWAVKSDQFDDLEKQGLSILFEEDKNKNDRKPQPEHDQNDLRDK
ncbi:cbb3-type cytochrome oxidase assembly protein CcoS [Thalassotalea sediminis]|uniref:cbb3-type cytochrome oxidase assembly protein CcoS n=1 Tax=Thalassotalea sediminis TaxID=1759089 RepID=UPI002574811A|nr:cbb3-type cytochrome oxidase assembly protein CcoS [Thalassotalea sediminis]